MARNVTPFSSELVPPLLPVLVVVLQVGQRVPGGRVLGDVDLDLVLAVLGDLGGLLEQVARAPARVPAALDVLALAVPELMPETAMGVVSVVVRAVTVVAGVSGVTGVACVR